MSNYCSLDTKISEIYVYCFQRHNKLLFRSSQWGPCTKTNTACKIKNKNYTFTFTHLTFYLIWKTSFERQAKPYSKTAILVLYFFLRLVGHLEEVEVALHAARADLLGSRMFDPWLNTRSTEAELGSGVLCPRNSYSRITKLEREFRVPFQRHPQPVVNLFPDLLLEDVLHGEPCLRLHRLTDIGIGRSHV